MAFSPSRARARDPSPRMNRVLVASVVAALLVLCAHVRSENERENEWEHGGRGWGASIRSFGSSVTTKVSELRGNKAVKAQPEGGAKSKGMLTGVSERMSKRMSEMTAVMRGGKAVKKAVLDRCDVISVVKNPDVCKPADNCRAGRKCCFSIEGYGHACFVGSVHSKPDRVRLGVILHVDELRKSFFVRIYEKTVREFIRDLTGLMQRPICVQPLGVYESVAQKGETLLSRNGYGSGDYIGKSEVCVQIVYDENEKTLSAEESGYTPAMMHEDTVGGDLTFGTIKAYPTYRLNCKDIAVDDPRQYGFTGCHVSCACHHRTVTTKRRLFGRNDEKTVYDCTDCEPWWQCDQTATWETSPAEASRDLTSTKKSFVDNAMAEGKCKACSKCADCKGGRCKTCIECEGCSFCDIQSALHDSTCLSFGCKGPYDYAIPHNIMERAIRENKETSGDL